MMEDKGRILLLLFYWIFAIERVSSFTFCKESATKIRYVSKCPSDAQSWEIAAKDLNCETIKQNCSSAKQHQFQYHCVINEFKNALLEVCALNRTIFGYCTEYNTMGQVIQEHYNAECTKHGVPCPELYNSAEAYKYQECFQLLKGSPRNSEINLNFTQQILKSPSNRSCGELVLIVLIIFSITYLLEIVTTCCNFM